MVRMLELTHTQSYQDTLDDRPQVDSFEVLADRVRQGLTLRIAAPPDNQSAKLLADELQRIGDTTGKPVIVQYIPLASYLAQHISHGEANATADVRKMAGGASCVRAAATGSLRDA
jgi:hypothetical protein